MNKFVIAVALILAPLAGASFGALQGAQARARGIDLGIEATYQRCRVEETRSN